MRAAGRSDESAVGTSTPTAARRTVRDTLALLGSLGEGLILNAGSTAVGIDELVCLPFRALRYVRMVVSPGNRLTPSWI